MSAETADPSIRGSRTSVGTEMFLRFTLMLSLLSLLITFFSCLMFRNACIAGYGDTALAIAKTTASSINGDVFAAEMSLKVGTSHWQAVQKQLNATCDTTHAAFLYAVSNQAENGNLRYYASAGFNRTVGSTQDRRRFAPEIADALRNGAYGTSGIYDAGDDVGTRHGMLISGFAPIHDSARNVVGVVGADVPVDEALEDVHSFGCRLFAGSALLTALIAAAASRLVKTRIGEPLRALSDMSRRLAGGNFDLARPPSRNGEIGVLSDNLRRVAGAVKTLTAGADSLTHPGIAIPNRGARIASAALPGEYRGMAEEINSAMILMDSIDAYVYVIDPVDYRILYFNRKLRKRYHLDPEACGKTCWQLLSEDPRQGPCVTCQMPVVAARPVESAAIEWEFYQAATDSWYQVRNSLIPWPNGRNVFLAEAREITASKRLEERLRKNETKLARSACRARQASTLKSNFLASMAHEIRTPMNGIIGFAELAMDDRELSPRERGYLEKIRSSADGLLTVVDDILDISKTETGRLEPEFAPFTVKDVFRYCELVTAPRAEEKGLRLYIHADPHSSGRTLLGDAAKLRQALLNLLSNAVKFTNRGMVKLQCAFEREEAGRVHLRFEVSDSGAGIDKARLPHIFDAFAKSENSAARRFGGVGLGLAVAGSCVEAMGGTLDVASTPGIGSKFTFTLAFEPRDEAAAVAGDAPKRKDMKV